MKTILNINVIDSHCRLCDSVEFYSAEKWNRETESQLLRQIPQLLEIIRLKGLTLQIDLVVKTDYPEELTLYLNRKQKNKIVINDQHLTPREVEVLMMIMSGYTNKEIAKKLFICYETVKTHRKNILTKTKCKNTAMLINHYHETFFEKE